MNARFKFSQNIIVPVTLAFLVGCLSIAPYVYAFWFVGPSPLEGEKLHYFYQDSELRYISRMREITEANWPAASPVFHEYKDVSQTQQPYGEGVYALLSLGNPDWLPGVVLFTKFFFPALLFLLLYGLSRLLIASTSGVSRVSSRVLALFIAFIVAQGLGAHRLSFLLELLTSSSTTPELSKWTRTVNPIFGGLTLFSTLLLVVAADKRTFSLARALAIGALVGVSSAYFFSFVLVSMILLVWGLFLLLYREWQRLWELAAAGVIAVVINLNYFLSILNGGEESTVSLEKNGLFFTHEPLLNYGIMLAAIVFAAALILEKQRYAWSVIFSKLWWRFGVAALIGSLLAYNIQVVLGATVWPGHFAQYTDHLSLIVIFISLVSIAMWVGRKLKNKISKLPSVNRLIITVAPFMVGVLVALQIASIGSVHTWSERYEDIQKYAPVFSWLNSEHPDGDCVVFLLGSDDVTITDYVTAYTACDVYHSHFVFMALPEERIMHNYVAYLRLSGVTSETIDEYLEENQREWQDLFYSNWREKFAQSNDRWLERVGQPGQVERFLTKTPSIITDEFSHSLDIPLKTFLEKYKLDYVITSDADNVFGIGHTEVTLVAPQESGLRLYRLE